MKEVIGKTYSIAHENPAVKGCTVSKQVLNTPSLGIYYFSLAEATDISAESYEYHKLLLIADGTAEVYTKDNRSWTLVSGQAIITPLDVPVGIKTKSGTIYTELRFGKETVMNNIIKPGEVFTLKELLPVQQDKIVNMDIAHNDKMKFVLMSFSAGTGLAEHAAPGDALIFALEGEGIIGYEGKEHKIKAGENFRFAKNGRHSVTAVSDFKMALLLTLE